MTHVSIRQSHTDDERWIEAGSDAFALHVAALVYCDRLLTGGCISEAMARRVSLAVPPRRAGKAIAQLVRLGFWRTATDGYQIEDFNSYAIPADEQRATRARWKADKDRQRQHKIGDHSLCKDPKYCPAIRERSTVETGVEAVGAATGGGSPLYPTQLNQNRPDPTRPEGGEGKGKGSVSGADGGSASLAVALPPPPQDPTPSWAGGPPPGVVPSINGVPVEGPRR